VLKAIASTVPDDVELMVIFENWNASAPMPELALNSQLSADFLYLANDLRPYPFLPRAINSIFNFIRGGHHVFLSPVAQTLPAGTCVLMIRSVKP
jgi:hypothetical protein